MFVAVVVILFNISGTELVLHRDLDTNGSSATPASSTSSPAPSAGSPAYHALSMSALAERMA